MSVWERVKNAIEDKLLEWDNPTALDLWDKLFGLEKEPVLVRQPAGNPKKRQQGNG